MAKPLHSDIPNPPSNQFAHFGVLDTGKGNKRAAVVSVTINVTILLIVIVLGMVVKNNPVIAKKVAELTLPPKPPMEQPKPKPPPPPPPKPLPKPPEIKVEPPKIKMPEPIKPPPDIKPIPVPIPKPVILQPAPPKAVTPPPAPVKVNLAKATAASVANNDAHPSAVRLGNMTNPINNTTGPAVSNVNLGRSGAPGMPGSNTGLGPASKVSIAGSGAPNGKMGGTDNAARAVVGVKMGTPGSTGPLTSKNFANAPVNLGVQTKIAQQPQVASRVAGTAPTVVYKPAATYTEAAKAKHIEGGIQVRIRVLASGAVQFLGITKGLDPGLDQDAKRVAEGMRFKPALDSTGHPIDQEIEIIVRYQLAG